MRSQSPNRTGRSAGPVLVVSDDRISFAGEGQMGPIGSKNPGMVGF